MMEVGPTAVRLILASASPRRRELLRQSGFDPIVHPANIDEDAVPPGLSPRELALHLARSKALAVAGIFPDDLVLGADTVVAVGASCMSKPADQADARRMLRLLSGTTHQVITGVCLLGQARKLCVLKVIQSTVRMRPLSEAQIEACLADGQWRGKAGAYGIQDNDPFVQRIDGSYSNIVGLPMEATARMLADAGIFTQR